MIRWKKEHDTELYFRLMAALIPPGGNRPSGGKIPARALVRVFGPGNARKLAKLLVEAAQEEEWDRSCYLAPDGEATVTDYALTRLHAAAKLWAQTNSLRAEAEE